MDELAPHRRYYLHHQGRWSGVFSLAIIDWRAFWAAPVPLFERAALPSWALLPRGLPIARLETEVFAEQSGEVLHTTTLRVLGVAPFASEERFFLGADGVSLTIARRQRVGPAWWGAAIEDTVGAIKLAGASDGWELALREVASGALLRAVRVVAHAIDPGALRAVDHTPAPARVHPAPKPRRARAAWRRRRSPRRATQPRSARDARRRALAVRVASPTHCRGSSWIRVSSHDARARGPLVRFLLPPGA